MKLGELLKDAGVIYMNADPEMEVTGIIDIDNTDDLFTLDKIADIIITVTGCKDIISEDHLAVMKDGQAVFTNLEKVYLYRYVFTF